MTRNSAKYLGKEVADHKSYIESEIRREKGKPVTNPESPCCLVTSRDVMSLGFLNWPKRVKEGF